MQMICIKCGKKNYAQPHNLKKCGTTDENYMCFYCSRKYKHHYGKINMKPQYDIKYLAYLRVINSDNRKKT
jgi:hypothetical protein